MRLSPINMKVLIGWIALVCNTVAIAAGPFVGPKDGPSAFRRDRIPLEIDHMRRLSNSLTLMATTVSLEQAENRRLAAQCLALALACEPSNRDARELVRALENENFIPRRHSDLGNALAHGAAIVAWLDQEAAGPDAIKLAAYLKDVVSRVGKKEPRYRELGITGMLGDWNNLVPSLNSYLDEDSPDPDLKDDNPGSNFPTEPNNGDFQLAHDKAEITIPMWYPAIKPINGQRWILKPGRMFVRAEYDEEAKHEPFRMQVGGNFFNEQMTNFSRAMTTALHEAMGELPGGLRVDISSEALEEALRSGQPQSISAAAIVLAGSIVRGKIPDSETIVLGKVNTEGHYLPSSEMWQQLKAFSGGKGQRLVVPAKSKPYFDAMLTMDRISYFLEYEVVMASNIDELLNAACSQPEGAIGEAVSKFAEIQKVAPDNNVRSFVVNSHVRKRLEDVVKASPQHLSGALLLMQANAARPFNITREVFCAEMKAILQPLGQVKAIPWDLAEEREFKRLSVGEMTKEARQKVAALERYVGREERQLYQDVDAVFDAMREYDKALNKRGGYDFITGVLYRASRSAERAFEDYAEVLDEALHD